MDVDILPKPLKEVKPAHTVADRLCHGRESDNIEHGVGMKESSIHTSTSSAVISGERIQTVSVPGPKRRASDDNHIETDKVKVMNFGNEKQGKVVTCSPEQVVTIRPQYGRLIPELSPMSQRVKSANATVNIPTTGSVKAVFSVAGSPTSPHLQTDSVVWQNLTAARSDDPQRVIPATCVENDVSVSTTAKSRLTNVSGSSVPTKMVTPPTQGASLSPICTVWKTESETSLAQDHSSPSDVKAGKPTTITTSSATVASNATGRTLLHHQQQGTSIGTISTPLSSLPAGNS